MLNLPPKRLNLVKIGGISRMRSILDSLFDSYALRHTPSCKMARGIILNDPYLLFGVISLYLLCKFIQDRYLKLIHVSNIVDTLCSLFALRRLWISFFFKDLLNARSTYGFSFCLLFCTSSLNSCFMFLKLLCTWLFCCLLILFLAVFSRLYIAVVLRIVTGNFRCAGFVPDMISRSISFADGSREHPRVFLP